nr:PREDICTED: solute carrier family 23 member 2-like isoform X1 [Equus przewalskii]
MTGEGWGGAVWVAGVCCRSAAGARRPHPPQSQARDPCLPLTFIILAGIEKLIFLYWSGFPFFSPWEDANRSPPVAVKSAMTSCEHPDFLQQDDNMLSSQDDGRGKKKDGQPGSPSSSHLAYGILDVPPWYLCILLGIQHFLTALGGLVAVPLILAKDLCLQHDPLTKSYLISTMFFVSGICTLLQVFFGVSYSLRRVCCLYFTEGDTGLQKLGNMPGSHTNKVEPDLNSPLVYAMMLIGVTGQ